jgi:hypothetical protein
MLWTAVLENSLLQILSFTKQGVFSMGPSKGRETKLLAPSKHKCQILLHSESDLLFLLKGPLNLFGDFAGLRKTFDYFPEGFD